MRNAQGFLLVFSITSLSSLQELDELREQIARMKGEDPQDPIPLVLVGNKCDLEDDRAVSRAKAFSICQAWGGVPYYETSARRRQNVNQVFVDVCRQMICRDVARRARDSRRDNSSRKSRRPYYDPDEARNAGGYSDRPHGGGHRESYKSRRSRRHHGSRCVIL